MAQAESVQSARSITAAGLGKTERKDGCWVLNGGKTFTTNAHFAQVCVAMAVTDRKASHHGISAFVIDAGTPGYRTGKKENKLGMRASETASVVFEDCYVPDENMLGNQGEGWPGEE